MQTARDVAPPRRKEKMDDMGHTSGRASVEGAPRNLARLDTLPPSHTPTGRERWAERSTRGLLCIPVLLPPQEDPQQPLRYPADRLIFLLTRYCAEKLGSARLGRDASAFPHRPETGNGRRRPIEGSSRSTAGRRDFSLLEGVYAFLQREPPLRGQIFAPVREQQGTSPRVHETFQPVG
jgi:hypothetical protein